MVNLNVKEGISSSSLINTQIPTGALMMKASTASLLTSYATDAQCIAAGYVPCDGRTLNASTFPIYQSLFNIIGNIYGGTDNTNFTVPNLRTSRRYLYGQPTAVSAIYTPSFSANTVNAVTHSHGSTGTTGESLLTNAVAGSHTHAGNSGNTDTGTSPHNHTAAFNIAAFTTGGGAGTTLTKADGTGTAAGAAHTHTASARDYSVTPLTSGGGGANHSHTSAAGTSSSHTEPTHTHTVASTNVSIPISTGFEIPYISVLYFIKI